jgi:hypothetical protein
MIIEGRGSRREPDYEADSNDFMDPDYIRGDQVAFLNRSWPTSSTAC